MFSSPRTDAPPKGVTTTTLNLADADQLLCETALKETGSIVYAARLLGITRHALKRKIIKHNIAWPPPRPRPSTPEGGPDVH